MHSSTIATVFTFVLAASATALPADFNVRNSGCSTKAANKCCNGFAQSVIGGILSPIGLGCTNIVGSTCTSGSAACCTTQQNGLINVNVCQVAL